MEEGIGCGGVRCVGVQHIACGSATDHAYATVAARSARSAYDCASIASGRQPVISCAAEIVGPGRTRER